MSELSFEHFDPQYELCVDAQGKPIRPRKKPGRKPNPPSPAQRKAQNRAAQRAFRERKRQEIKEAETTNRRYLKMHQESLVTIQELQRHIKTLEYENGYLKGQLLTLKITCMAHRVDVPKFWDTGARDRMGSDLFTCSQSKDLPQPLEFFLDRSRRIVCGDLTGCEPSLGSTLSSYMISPALSSLMTNSFSFQSPLSLVESSDWKDKEEENWLSSDIIQLFDLKNLFPSLTPEQPVKEDFWTEEIKMDDKIYVPGPLSPLEAISKMRSTKEEGGFDYFLTPTELQRRVPHDARIDLVPGPTMRDSMILFQDYYDSNELFNFLIEHAVFIGGELGNPDCWFVPPEFISNYWFLCPSYRPMRLDNSVEIAVGFAQKMVTSTLKKRKEMYIQRDQYQDAFPQPTLSEEMEEDVKQDYTLDTLVLHHINRDVPKIISTV